MANINIGLHFTKNKILSTISNKKMMTQSRQYSLPHIEIISSPTSRIPASLIPDNGLRTYPKQCTRLRISYLKAEKQIQEKLIIYLSRSGSCEDFGCGGGGTDEGVTYFLKHDKFLQVSVPENYDRDIVSNL